MTRQVVELAAQAYQRALGFVVATGFRDKGVTGACVEGQVMLVDVLALANKYQRGIGEPPLVLGLYTENARVGFVERADDAVVVPRGDGGTNRLGLLTSLLFGDHILREHNAARFVTEAKTLDG